MIENNDKLKIFQISTPYIALSPEMKYGGTERVILYLDEQFVKGGHSSIVAAPRESRIAGELLSTVPSGSWRVNEEGIMRTPKDRSQYTETHEREIVNFLSKNEEIDIVHDHMSNFLISGEYFERGQQIRAPILTTLHVPYLNLSPEIYGAWRRIKTEGRKVFFNAISQSQKRHFEKKVDVCDVIYHGIPLDRFPFEEKKSDYLFSLGKISYKKGQHIAIEVAKKTGMRLIIAGEIQDREEIYFREMIEPNIDGDQIRFIGSLNDQEKVEWYKNALVFLMPINWEEAFGLVMIESMACGTPVIAFNRGSVPEIVKHGKTGFVVDTSRGADYELEEMVRAVNRIGEIKPADCRRHVEEEFSIEEEARNYIELYRRIIN